MYVYKEKDVRVNRISPKKPQQILHTLSDTMAHIIKNKKKTKEVANFLAPLNS